MSKNLDELFSSSENNFNLIRLLAAASVIYGHASVVTGTHEPDFLLRLIQYKFIGGVAVDIFFVLSGFLIAASVQSGKGVSYFIASRVLRVYPGLIVCILLSVVFLGTLFSKNFDFFSPQVWRYVWVNGTAINTEYFIPGIFSDRPDKAINGSLWSIPVELRMYAFVLLLFVTGPLARKHFFNGMFFISAFFAYFFPEALTGILLHPSHLHVVVMYMVGVFYWVNRKSVPMNPWILFVLILFAATVQGTPKFSYAYTLLLPYLIWCIGFTPGIFWFNRLGDYSYGVYLYGWPVQQAVSAINPSLSYLQNTTISIIVALIFGIFSWRFIERPALQLKKYFQK